MTVKWTDLGFLEIMDLVKFFLKQGGKIPFISVVPVVRKSPVLLSGERVLSIFWDGLNP